MQAFSKSLKINSKYHLAWVGLGLIFNDQGRYKEAGEAYSRAIEQDKNNVIIWNNFGISLSAQGLYKDAEAAYGQALKIDPYYANAWSGLGGVFWCQLLFKKAEIAYRKAIEIDPKDAAAHLNIGGLYLRGLNRKAHGINESLVGLILNHESAYGIKLLTQYWRSAVSLVVTKITANEPGADNLRTVLTEVLLERAAAGEQALSCRLCSLGT